MIVKVHPHRTKYLSGDPECVSVTRMRGGRQNTFYATAVSMREVTLRVQPAGVLRAQTEKRRNVHAWCVGQATHIWRLHEPIDPALHTEKGVWTQVTYHYNSGEFRILDTGENVTGLTFPYAHIVGRDFYILDNRGKV